MSGAAWGGGPPAAHTLTPTLLPTTCVVVNKLVGLTLSDNRGCAPPVRKCLPPTVKSPQEGPLPTPLHGFGHCGFDARGRDDLIVVILWLPPDPHSLQRFTGVGTVALTVVRQREVLWTRSQPVSCRPAGGNTALVPVSSDSLAPVGPGINRPPGSSVRLGQYSCRVARLIKVSVVRDTSTVFSSSAFW